jgi:hydrogenase maturation protease
MSIVDRHVLVIGLGNPDRGDDGVGVRVAETLEGTLPNGVTLKSRRGDMLALLEDWRGYDEVICVDAAAPMGNPGHIHRIEPHADALPITLGLASSHGIGLAEALALSRALGTAPERLIVFAIEGVLFETGAPLSPEVAAAVAGVAALVHAEVAVKEVSAPEVTNA